MHSNPYSSAIVSQNSDSTSGTPKNNSKPIDTKEQITAYEEKVEDKDQTAANNHGATPDIVIELPRPLNEPAASSRLNLELPTIFHLIHSL